MSTTEMAELISVVQELLEVQRLQLQEQRQQAEALLQEQRRQAEAQLQEQRRQAEAREEKLIQALSKGETSTGAPVPIAYGGDPTFTETVHGQASVSTTPIFRVNQKQASPRRKATGKTGSPFAKGVCPRCGKADHHAKECRFIGTTCRFCQKKGHIEAV